MTISEDIKKITQDEMMKEFKGEISGILNWALEGWMDYRKMGYMSKQQLKMPPQKINLGQIHWRPSLKKNVNQILLQKST